MTEGIPVASEPESQMLDSEKFVEKLRTALRRDGDFPASAKVVAELKELVADPNTTANQITEIILREPSLGTRVLHMVNSSFYQRSKPIMTVSRAVIQVGMRPIAELCAGLVLLQKFIPKARTGGSFADCLQKVITTSLLASSLSDEISETNKQANNETSYLAGTFFELGTLLLAYYFPKVYDAALKRSETKQQALPQSIQDLTGLSPVRLSVEVIDALGLPEFYKEVLLAGEQGDDFEPSQVSEESKKTNPSVISKSLFAAYNISEVITSGGDKEELDAVLSKIDQKIEIDAQSVSQVVGELPQKFRDHCSNLELHLSVLPEYVESYQASESNGVAPDLTDEVASTPGTQVDQFSQFVDEIRESVENREPTAAVITSVMETFAWSLQFDRVLLLLTSPDKKYLAGRMVLGNVTDLDPKTVRRPLGSDAGPYNPDAVAIRDSRPVFCGDPILEDGWPFAVIPIGFSKRVIGCIYADRIDSNEDELSGKEQAAIGILAELLDRSISSNS